MSEDKQKVVIVVDTNFIIETKKVFVDVIKRLSENYEMYVTEISICERIAQRKLELKSDYDDIEKFKTSFEKYADISIKVDFEKIADLSSKGIRKNYQKIFENNIIPLNSTEKTLNEILERAYKKTPPFAVADNASDKGFKDTLLWMSMLQFFKEYSDKIDVVFISSDKGFIKNAELLKEEFANITGKTIEFKDNSYYKMLTGETVETLIPTVMEEKELSTTERRELRERIEKVVGGICYFEEENPYGYERYVVKYFTLDKILVPDDIKIVFENLYKVLEAHIFDTNISPNIVFEPVASLNGKYEIPIENLEDVLELFKSINTKYNEYLNPFFITACEIINRNFVEVVETSVTDEELPF